MNVLIHKQDDWTVIKPGTTRLDVQVVPELKDKLAEIVDSGEHLIILDLRDVNFIDSAGLGAMVYGLRKLGGRGDLVLAGAGSQIRALLEITRLDQIFDVVETPEEILQRSP